MVGRTIGNTRACDWEIRQIAQSKLARGESWKKGGMLLQGLGGPVSGRGFQEWDCGKLDSQWFGAFKVVEVKQHAVVVQCSPQLGGLMEVAHYFPKKYRQFAEVGEEMSDITGEIGDSMSQQLK